MTSALLPLYNHLDFTPVRGAGCELFDADGKRHLDFLSGVAVCNLGHTNPALTAVLHKQAQQLWHTSNWLPIAPAEQLAARIVASAFDGKVAFSNSGAEANEGALKLARKYQCDRGHADKTEIISFAGGFHGRTLLTLTVTGKAGWGDNFAPLPPDCRALPYSDSAALGEISARTAAVIVEIVQGEAGVICADDDWLRALRAQCDAVGALLIFDEVQTGCGRTGELWAWQRSGVRPDVMTFAKALGNGLPIGGFLAADGCAGAFGAGDHGSTFGGGWLVTAVADEVLRTITAPEFLAEVRAKGEYFAKLLRGLPQVDAVRGCGLMWAISGDFDAAAVLRDALADGIILNAPRADILRFLPPLVVSRGELAEVAGWLKQRLKS